MVQSLLHGRHSSPPRMAALPATYGIGSLSPRIAISPLCKVRQRFFKIFFSLNFIFTNFQNDDGKEYFEGNF